MKKMIAHYVENFPASGESYVYDQVRSTSRYEGRLFSEYRLPSSYDAGILCESYVRLTSKLTLNRIFKAVRNRVLPELHNRFLCRWYETRLAIQPPNLIHAHFGTTAFKIIELKRKLNVPLFVTFYGVDISQVLRLERWRHRYQELLAEADKLIVLFDEGIERLADLGADRKKICVWDIGIPLSDYPYRKPTPNKKKVKFLIVARFVEKKGYFILLEAFHKLQKIHPYIALTIMGNGPLKIKILNRIQELGLQEQVRLTDTENRNDFFTLFKQTLRDHDIFVLPSIVSPGGDDEGGPPVVITNAMAVGLPVISTSVGGITRAIIDKKTGYLTESGNCESLLNRMRYCIEHQGEWTAITDSARRLAEDRFDVHRQLEKLENLYAETLKQHESK